MALRTRLITAALLLTAVSAAPAQAQWATLDAGNISNNGGEFWDNSSSDGATCNVGYILTGGASTSCGAQRPSGWLPYTGPAMAQYRPSNTGFGLFNATRSR